MIRLIDLNSGNLCSLKNWLTRNNLSFSVEHKDDSWNSRDIILLPGVGNSVTFTDKLKKWTKVVNAIKTKRVKKVIAICGGFHSLCSSITEAGETTSGLNIIKADCLPFDGEKFHTGWSKVALPSLPKNPTYDSRFEFYFNHGCRVMPLQKNAKFIMDVHSDFAVAYFSNYLNLVQFHPEKSGALGDKLTEILFDV